MAADPDLSLSEIDIELTQGDFDLTDTASSGGDVVLELETDDVVIDIEYPEAEFVLELETDDYLLEMEIDDYVIDIETEGLQGPAGPASTIPGPQGPPGPGLSPATFSRLGELTTTTGNQRFYVEYGGEVLGLRVAVGVPPIGSSIVVALRQNNVVIATATVLSAQLTSGYVTVSAGTIVAGDYFTVDIQQVGSANPGSDLTVAVWIKAVE